jgi:ABC-type transport system involved in multi-copper enzyme maturation permease subunit
MKANVENLNLKETTPLMAVLTIAGLTLKEAVRRRTLFGALLMGCLVLALSLLPVLIRQRMLHSVEVGRMSELRFTTEFPIIRSVVMTLCLAVIKSLGAFFAVLMAGGAISGEIERGLLSVILSKPLARWQILLGKWIGLNIVLMGSVYLWTAMVWASFTLQTHEDQTPILVAGLYLMLYPLLASTLTLSLSTTAQRMLGTSMAIVIIAIAWFDGILNAMGMAADVDIVKQIATLMGLLLPQGYVGWWVEEVMKDITFTNPRRGAVGQSPTFLKDWGAAHLHFAHLDAVYVAAYIVVVFLIGAALFQRRDI